MIGANEAFRFLKDELDLSEARSVPSSSEAYVAMHARNPYLSFRPLSVFLKAGGHFRLVATTRGFEYPNLCEPPWFNENDKLGLGSYMAGHEPIEWATIKEQYPRILSRIEKTVNPHQDAARRVRYHWYDKDGTKKKRLEIQSDVEHALAPEKQTLEALRKLMTQKVQLADNAVIKISAERHGLSVDSPTYYGREYVPTVSNPRWQLRSKLLASMPCQVDETHTLVAGVSNNLNSIELSIPADDPSITVEITANGKPDSVYQPNLKRSGIEKYQFNLKKSGIEKRTLKKMIHLLLI